MKAVTEFETRPFAYQAPRRIVFHSRCIVENFYAALGAPSMEIARNCALNRQKISNASIHYCFLLERFVTRTCAILGGVF